MSRTIRVRVDDELMERVIAAAEAERPAVSPSTIIRGLLDHHLPPARVPATARKDPPR